jgi:hypothetical protein
MQPSSKTTFAILLSGILSFPAIGLSADQSKAPEPIMVKRGEAIVSRAFMNAGEVDKKSIAFRKQTQFQVRDGKLNVIPPSIAFNDKENDSEWATSTFARAGLLNVPAELVCQFRWKYNASSNRELQSKGVAYIDLGHRCIRLTMRPEGSVLVLENHLVGREERLSIVLQEVPELKLQPEKWYDVTVEVKGEEVVFQIEGRTIYGQHPLIAKERYDKFNIDVDGEGYLLDYIDVWAAGEFRSDWQSRRERLLK